MSTKLIYFHIDEVARDAVVAANLRRILKGRNVELYYGNRAESEVMRMFDTSSAFDLCVFPSLDQFKATCPDPKRWSTPVLILPSETVGGTTSNVDRLAAKYFGSYPDECWPWIEKVSTFCVWGESHLKAFHAKGPHLLRLCQVVGHPRFDRRCLSQKPRETPNRARIQVGIISRFSALNHFDSRGMLQVILEGRKLPDRVAPIYRLSPDRNVEDRVYTEVIDLRHIFEFIDSLDPKTHEVTIRAHPRENRSAWRRLIDKNGLRLKLAEWDQPFLHWVTSLDYVVGPVSTSFYDCSVAGRRPICTVDIAPHRQDHILKGGDDENPILNFVLRPKSIAELTQMISTRPLGQEFELPEGLLDVLRKEANYPDCAHSLDNVANVCGTILGKAEAGKTRSASRFKHRILARSHSIYSGTRSYDLTEQSATFRLTASRREWIDGLAVS